MQFVWCTIGTSPREQREAKAVLVEANDLDEAIDKVCKDVSAEDEELYEAQKEAYGSEWFLQELADERL